MVKMQVGMVAYRDKDGNFLPSSPIYRECEDKKSTDYKLTETEKQICNNIIPFLIPAFNEYMQHREKEAHYEQTASNQNGSRLSATGDSNDVASSGLQNGHIPIF